MQMLDFCFRYNKNTFPIAYIALLSLSYSASKWKLRNALVCLAMHSEISIIVFLYFHNIKLFCYNTFM